MERMLFDNVLLKEKKDESKVIVAGESKKNTKKGIVVNVGPGQSYGLPKFEPTTVKVGDVVYFLAEVAFKVTVKEEEHWVVREREILGILGA